MSGKHLNQKQLAILQALVSGKSYSEISAEHGVSRSAITRLRKKFADTLDQQAKELSSQIAEGVSTARMQGVELIQDALDQLRVALHQSETVDEKLNVINVVLRAFQVLNPVQTQGSVAIQQNENDSHGQVVVLLPDNQREKR